MQTARTLDHFRGVFPVPPLCRNHDGTLNLEETEKIARHIAAGGIGNLLYGGNAFLYHVTMREYEALLDWLSGLAREFVIIPSAGPSFGRAMDQAPLLAKSALPCVMMLPCADPRDAVERKGPASAGPLSLRDTESQRVQVSSSFSARAMSRQSNAPTPMSSCTA